MDPGAGFYANKSNNASSATVSDVSQGVKDGSIVFGNNATIVFGSCHACGAGANPPLAEKLTIETGVTTIGATGFVEPEIVNGKETGKLTTTGTFMKTEKSFTVSFSNTDGNVVHSATLGSQNAVDNYSKGFNFDGAYTQSVTSKIIQTDLGNVIDPNKL